MNAGAGVCAATPCHLSPVGCFLIGPRGSGKTTVAALLAERLGWAWVDADAVLEQRAGRSIRELFAVEGEPGFRAGSGRCCATCASWTTTVIATGGGVVLHPDNRERLRQAGIVVWLTADVDALWQRIAGDAGTVERRPALGVGGRDEVAQVLRGARTAVPRVCSFQRGHRRADAGRGGGGGDGLPRGPTWRKVLSRRAECLP